MIGHANDGGTNHQYDMHDFFDAVKAGNFPAVSFLKSAAYRDGHAGYSDPLDEAGIPGARHQFHRADPAVERTRSSSSPMTIPMDGMTTSTTSSTAARLRRMVFRGRESVAMERPHFPAWRPSTLHAQGRCGYGPRLPLLVISPWAKPNYVSHTVTDQSSILRFIEDTFLNQQRIGQGSYDANRRLHRRHA